MVPPIHQTASKEHHFDDTTYSKPGQDPQGPAQHVVMMIPLQVAEELVVGLMPGWPGAKDFAKAFDEGMPFLIAVQEDAESDSF
jgi:hypothetical protein